ncbi:MAG: redoxin domain-containing protein [Bacteroidales bacterium]|nr:redoxin domain-containing protein [Bacteroidales bacterium]
MKKFLLLVPVLALAISCGPRGNTYIVKGTVTDSLAMDPAAKISLLHSDGTKEEAAIEKGRFSFSGDASNEDLCHLTLMIGDRPAGRGEYSTSFIPEKGMIKIDLSEESVVTGGKLNKALTAYYTQVRDIVTDFQTKVAALVDSLGQSGAVDAVMELQDETIGKVDAISKAVFNENTDNAVGLAALSNFIHDLSSDELNDYLSRAGDFIKNDKDVKSLLESKAASKATAEGTMFVDFSGKSPDGKDVRLSDYVGKGKYTLVDFWASWCGPCREEIPNIKEIYEKYGKKVNVLGVAVWDGDNSATRKAMETLGMKWNQIFVGEDKTPTEVYGIEGIPHIILFAPDGTIFRRGLRGQEMIEAVKSVVR